MIDAGTSIYFGQDDDPVNGDPDPLTGKTPLQALKDGDYDSKGVEL